MPRSAPTGSDPTDWWRTTFLREVHRYVPDVLTSLRDETLSLVAKGSKREDIERSIAAWRRSYHLLVADQEDDWLDTRVRNTLAAWERRLPSLAPRASTFPPSEAWSSPHYPVSLMTYEEWRRWKRPVRRRQAINDLRAAIATDPESSGRSSDPERAARNARERLGHLRQWGPWHPALIRWWGPYHLTEPDSVTTDVRRWKERAHLRWLAQWQCGRWSQARIAENELHASRETLVLLARASENEALTAAERRWRLKLILLNRGEPWVSDREKGLWAATWDVDAEELDSLGKRIRALLRMRDGGAERIARGSITRAIDQTSLDIGLWRRRGRPGRPAGSTRR